MIFCVEDEQNICELEVYTLQSVGMEAQGCGSGRELFALLEKQVPELIVLDIMLPDEDGVSILRRLRADKRYANIPVIMATAKGSEFDKVKGLDSGADDYIAKPFKISILAMKAKRMLQRTEIAQRHEHRYAGIVLDTDAYKCYVNDEEVTLTQKEFVLLSEFMKNPGRVLTREWLLEQIWGYDFSGETRVVDTMVKNLRKKLGAKAHLIHTVISVGYKLEDTK